MVVRLVEYLNFDLGMLLVLASCTAAVSVFMWWSILFRICWFEFSSLMLFLMLLENSFQYALTVSSYSGAGICIALAEIVRVIGAWSDTFIVRVEQKW